MKVVRILVLLMLFSCNEQDINKVSSAQLNNFEETEESFDSTWVSNVFKTLKSNHFAIYNSDTVKIIKGFIFDPNIENVLVTYSYKGLIYLKGYSILSDTIYKEILSDSFYQMGFINDTIQDINGDGIGELIVHWYPSSGCCLADVYQFYFYDKEKQVLIPNKEVLNMVFYEKSNIIYSMSYGHPGETSIYKLKWKGSDLDTLSRFFHNAKHTEDGFIPPNTLIKIEQGKTVKISEYPSEIKELPYYEWFYPWQ
jgi:hypothetical protein